MPELKTDALTRDPDPFRPADTAYLAGSDYRRRYAGAFRRLGCVYCAMNLAGPYYGSRSESQVKDMCPECSPTAVREVLYRPASAPLPDVAAANAARLAKLTSNAGVTPEENSDVYRCQVCSAVSPPKTTAQRFVIHRQTVARSIARELLVCGSCHTDLDAALRDGKGETKALNDLIRAKQREEQQKLIPYQPPAAIPVPPTVKKEPEEVPEKPVAYIPLRPAGKAEPSRRMVLPPLTFADTKTAKNRKK